MIVDRARVAAALPGYELGDQLGAGAFGLVMAGWHRRLQRDVAVKVMAAAGPERAAAGFAAEARILAGLDHPHVVRVYDYVETDELRLIVMEMLGGGTLTRRGAEMNPETACAVGLAVAAALSCAHSRGVLHRDIKPDNVLFDTASVLKVVDFGIAKLVHGPAATASAVIGTPRFMAPEQVSGGRLGPATDVYALGVVLHLLLARLAPFDSVLPAHTRRPHPGRIHRSPAGVPAPVTDVILRALAEDPAARPPSARAFALDLARAAADVYGPGWTARSGIVLRLDDDVRTAAERPAATVRPVAPPATTSDPSSPDPSSPDPPSPPPTGSAPTGSASSGGVVDGSATRRRTWSRPRRAAPPQRRRRRSPRLRIAVAVVLLLAVAGTVLVTTVRNRNSGGTSVRPLGPPLTGHTDWVMSVAFSPDGRTLASGSKDTTAQLWDVSDRSNPRPVGQRLIGSITSVAFSPDGRTLAGGGWDNMVRLWDVSNPSAASPLGQPLTGHTDHVMSVAISPDGRTLASASFDKTVRLWDVSNPSAASPLGQPLTGHTDQVQSVAFSWDGRTLASGSADGTVLLWDVDDPSKPTQFDQPLTGHTDTVRSMAFSPDGHILASGSWDTMVRLWDVTDRSNPLPLGQPLTGHTNVVWAVAFSPDGRILASASFDTTVRLWDATDRSNPLPLGQPLTGHTGWVQSVAFSPDGRTLASAGADKTVRLWALD